MDVFQQLKEYEKQKDKKLLWDGVKAVLVWAASEQHRHLGSYIHINHIKDALTYSVRVNLITDKKENELQGKSLHILQSLPVYEFGSLEDTPNEKNAGVKINKDGILAGIILIETEFLKSTIKYDIFVVAWWAILVMAVFALFWQAITPMLKKSREEVQGNYYQMEFPREHSGHRFYFQ